MLFVGRDGPPSFMKVQLGDQIDSKMLLGMYRCTDIPGEFVWQPGVLTQVIRKTLSIVTHVKKKNYRPQTNSSSVGFRF